MTAMCPHCGYDFAADAPIEVGPWRVTPKTVTYRGVDVSVSRCEAGVLFALAKAGGDFVGVDALLNRVTDKENPNIIAVMVSRLRRKLPAAAIETVRGAGAGEGGYRWIGGQPAAARAA